LRVLERSFDALEPRSLQYFPTELQRSSFLDASGKSRRQ
jgi:hypothetical protein